jgi:molecular chaperone DnaJ
VRQTGFEGWSNIDDILAQFGDLFGFGRGARGSGGARFGRGRRSRGPRPGADSQASVNVDFRTAALGGKLSLRMQGMASCASCGGSGMGPGSPCQACRGSGVVERPRSVDVRIPEGTTSGQILRLKGLGDAGQNGGPAGDLLLQVEVEDDARFRRDGDDVISDLRVPLWTAALGGKVSGQTLRGNVDVRVPPETSSDTYLRLKGQGVRGGDHRFRIVIEVPKSLSEEQKELLRQASTALEK